MKQINCTETFSTPFSDPRDPYGPPLVRFHVRARDAETGRWWYVKSFRSGQFTWTSDMLYARAYSRERARFVQSCIPSEI